MDLLCRLRRLAGGDDLLTGGEFLLLGGGDGEPVPLDTEPRRFLRLKRGAGERDRLRGGGLRERRAGGECLLLLYRGGDWRRLVGGAARALGAGAGARLRALAPDVASRPRISLAETSCPSIQPPFICSIASLASSTRSNSI